MNSDDSPGRPGAGPSDDPEDLNRLRGLLGTPELAWLLARMRTRLESTGELTGTVTKPAASAGERAALARLFGRPVRAGQTASVSLDALDDTLRRSGAWPAGLASAVVALTGNVVDPSMRTAEREAWQNANETLRVLAADRPDLTPWVDRVIRAGALRRAAPSAPQAQELAERLVGIAGALPSMGDSLGVFSARTAGDAHALDAQTPLGSLAVGIAATLGSALGAPSSPDTVTGSARWRRDAWQSVGVVVDELSSTVLTLGLPGGSDSPTALALAALAGAGQPAILTLRQLAADEVGAVPPVVFVCENPAVVAAAADLLGADCAPLVCVNGRPGAAAMILLEALSKGGAVLRYHGDFDWDGLGIARALARRIPWKPWRFGAGDYEEACAALPGLPALPGLRGATVDTPWDSALADTMVGAGLKVEEELVLKALLADLGAARG